MSTIITSFKRPQETLRAVESALRQTHKDCEVIVVDDNGLGTEYQVSTAQILNNNISLGSVRYIPHDHNKGGNGARNSGVRASKGEYISFLDSDDEFLPLKTEIQLEYLEKYSSTMAVVCNTETVMRGETRGKSRDTGIIFDARPILCGNLKLSFGSSMFFRRECFDDLGLFDEKLIRNQEIDFLIRVLAKHEIHIIDDVLVRRHIDDRSNIPSAKRFAENKEYFLSKNIDNLKNIKKDGIREILMMQYLDVAKVAVRDRNVLLFFSYFGKAKPSLSAALKMCREILLAIKKYW